MAIDKKALARAIVPYVYEEAENQGLTTNSGSERLSIEGEIEDPSGESDGLYVEATVKCSCDRDFPMDKDTGWRDTAEARDLSYKVLEATVYADDDRDIDVTEELQSALSWPDTYGPKKGLREDSDDDWAMDEIDPDDPLITSGADAIGADIFEKNGRVVAGKVYSGKVSGTFGTEFDTGEYDEYTITYKVKAVKVGKDAWNSYFTPIKVTISSEGISDIDATEAIDNYWSSVNAMHSDEKDLDEAGSGKSPEQIISYNIESYGDMIVEDVVKRLRKKYPDYHISLPDLDSSDLRLKGRIEGDLEGYGKEIINYDVAINDMDSLSVFGIVVLWCKVTVTLDGKTVDITDDLDEKYTGENLMPDVYDGEYGDDDYYSDEEDLDEAGNRPSPEEYIGYNIEQFGNDILVDALTKLKKNHNDSGRAVVRGVINDTDSSDWNEKIKYDVTILGSDFEELEDLDFKWNRVVVSVNGTTKDITKDLEEKYLGEDFYQIWCDEVGYGEEDLDEGKKKALCESFKSSILANLAKKHGRVKYSQSNGSARKEVTIPLHLYTDDQLRDCVLKVSGKYLGFDGRDFTKPSTINNGSFGKGYKVYFEDGSILFIPSTKSTAPTQQQRDHYSKTFAKKRNKGTLKESAENLDYEW